MPSENELKSGFFSARLIQDASNPTKMVPDRVYTNDDMNNLLDGVLTYGIVDGVGDNMRVDVATASDDNHIAVTVNPGRGWFHSKWVRNESAQTIKVTKPNNGAYCMYFVSVVVDETIDSNTGTERSSYLELRPVANTTTNEIATQYSEWSAETRFIYLFNGFRALINPGNGLDSGIIPDKNHNIMDTSHDNQTFDDVHGVWCKNINEGIFSYPIALVLVDPNGNIPVDANNNIIGVFDIYEYSLYPYVKTEPGRAAIMAGQYVHNRLNSAYFYMSGDYMVMKTEDPGCLDIALSDVRISSEASTRNQTDNKIVTVNVPTSSWDDSGVSIGDRDDTKFKPKEYDSDDNLDGVKTYIGGRKLAALGGEGGVVVEGHDIWINPVVTDFSETSAEKIHTQKFTDAAVDIPGEMYGLDVPDPRKISPPGYDRNDYRQSGMLISRDTLWSAFDKFFLRTATKYNNNSTDYVRYGEVIIGGGNTFAVTGGLVGNEFISSGGWGNSADGNDTGVTRAANMNQAINPALTADDGPSLIVSPLGRVRINAIDDRWFRVSGNKPKYTKASDSEEIVVSDDTDRTNTLYSQPYKRTQYESDGNIGKWWSKIGSHAFWAEFDNEYIDIGAVDRSTKSTSTKPKKGERVSVLGKNVYIGDNRSKDTRNREKQSAGDNFQENTVTIRADKINFDADELNFNGEKYINDRLLYRPGEENVIAASGCAATGYTWSPVNTSGTAEYVNPSTITVTIPTRRAFTNFYGLKDNVSNYDVHDIHVAALKCTIRAPIMKRDTTSIKPDASYVKITDDTYLKKELSSDGNVTYSKVSVTGNVSNNKVTINIPAQKMEFKNAKTTDAKGSSGTNLLVHTKGLQSQIEVPYKNRDEFQPQVYSRCYQLVADLDWKTTSALNNVVVHNVNGFSITLQLHTAQDWLGGVVAAQAPVVVHVETLKLNFDSHPET